MAVAEQSVPTVLRAPSPGAGRPGDLQWYQHAVMYQLHVRGFYDSNGDGIGDFAGLLQKLDYLQDLGVTALWLLPSYPSPWKDGGYDIADFGAIDPRYGTLREFKSLLAQAHRRDMHVVIELVLNHSSDRHPWFERARRAPPGSTWRRFYVWSDDPGKYPEARVIFDEAEPSNWTWDPVARAYYFHRFYHHEPDLNYDNPDVRQSVRQVVDHWLGMGVDGLALNTVAYLYEREGTDCENLAETHEFLKDLRRHVNTTFGDRLLLAEVNQWPEEAAAYFGRGEQCQAVLHFPLMPRLYLALEAEDRRPIIDILEQTPHGPDGSRWVLFLRNQDELTLQMVTEQERNAMFRFYARDPQLRVHTGIRRRLMPLMENNRAKAELLSGLLFSLPGTPVIYYGDEIGMGDNAYLGDRAGVRTPMQWSPDRNAGFSAANPQQLFLPVITDPAYHYETINVKTQSQNPHSLLSWVKRLVARRKLSPALTSGSLEFIDTRNQKIPAFLRRHGGETVLVVANLSRFAQVAELKLDSCRNHSPVEVFGGVPFPPIGELPYMLTLAPYGFYWLVLRPPAGAGPGAEPIAGHSLKAGRPPAVIELGSDWTDVFAEPTRQILERLLPSFLVSRRWFGGKAGTIRSAGIEDVVPMPYPGDERAVYWTVVGVDYAEAPRERYLLPLSVAGEDRLRWKDSLPAEAVVARLRFQRDKAVEELLLYDAYGEEEFANALLETIAARKSLTGRAGRINAWTTRAFRRLRGPDGQRLPSRALGAETSNSALLYDERFLLKLIRRLDEGVNPDLEIGSYLTDAVAFANSPPIGGALVYSVADEEPVTLGILSGFVRNEGNAWEYTLNTLENYFERLLKDAAIAAPPEGDASALPLLELAKRAAPQAAQERLADYLQSAELLGRRTAEMHLALATDVGNPRFTPEPFSLLYQRSLYQNLRNQAQAALDLLQRRIDSLPAHSRRDGELVLSGGKELVERLRALLTESIQATRIRCHGDYHLGQALYTGNDFMIIDFEGEPARPISERQLKASPLRDVAGMLRSFDYACHAARAEHLAGLDLPEEESRRLDPWVPLWVAWTSAAYLRSYLAVAHEASFLPHRDSQVQVLLDAYLSEKALYELQYELNNRPDWAHIPLKGILNLLET